MKYFITVCSLLCFCFTTPSDAPADNSIETQAPIYRSTRPHPNSPQLQTAIMAEDLRDHQPVNPAVVFPVAAGKVFCFTSFSAVPGKIHIYHAWYHRDKLITRRKLSLEPPQWKTYSSIQLREDDRGPWRVEILDQNSSLLKTLYFSITD